MDDTRLVQTLTNGSIPSTDSITHHQLAQNELVRLQRHQLLTYVHSFQSTYPPSRPLIEFKDLLLQEQRLTHVLSTIYKLFISLSYTNSESPSFKIQWYSDLGIAISPTNWTKSFLVTHKLSMPATHQEHNCRIISHWYKSPSALHALDPHTLEVFGDVSHQLLWFISGLTALWCLPFPKL